jgi:hypothetical protein
MWAGEGDDSGKVKSSPSISNGGQTTRYQEWVAWWSDDDNEVQPLLLYLYFPVTSVVVVVSLSIALPLSLASDDAYRAEASDGGMMMMINGEIA